METIADFSLVIIGKINILMIDLGLSPVTAAASGAVLSRQRFWSYIFKFLTILFFFQKLYYLIRLLKRKAFRKFLLNTIFSILSTLAIIILLVLIFTSCSSPGNFLSKKVFNIDASDALSGNTNNEAPDFDENSRVSISQDTFTTPETGTLNRRNYKFIEINSHINKNLLGGKHVNGNKTLIDLKSSSRIKKIVNISDDSLATFNSCSVNRELLINLIRKVQHSYGFFSSNSYRFSENYLYFHSIIDSVNTTSVRVLFRFSTIGGVKRLKSLSKAPFPYLISYLDYTSSSDNLGAKKWPLINKVRWSNLNLFMLRHFRKEGATLIVDANSSTTIVSPSVDTIYKSLNCDKSSKCLAMSDKQIRKKIHQFIALKNNLRVTVSLSPKFSIDIINLLIKEKRCKSQKLRNLRKHKLLGIIPTNNDSEILLFP